MSEFMTVAEVADHLRVTDKTIYRLLWSGQVPAAKIGQQWRFERGSIDNWVQRNSVGAKANILVIDDEEVIQSLFREILQELGHRVMVAGNGFDGLQLVKQWAFDLVFLDLKMDGVGGMEVLSVLRRQWPETIVIVLTGHPTLETVFEALRQGAFDYMFKPCRIADLRESVGKGLCQRKRMMDHRGVSLQDDPESLPSHDSV